MEKTEKTLKVFPLNWPVKCSSPGCELKRDKLLDRYKELSILLESRVRSRQNPDRRCGNQFREANQDLLFMSGLGGDEI